MLKMRHSRIGIMGMPARCGISAISAVVVRRDDVYVTLEFLSFNHHQTKNCVDWIFDIRSTHWHDGTTMLHSGDFASGLFIKNVTNITQKETTETKSKGHHQYNPTC